MPRVGSGSNVQPRRSEASVGGSAGVAPWAATGLAVASQPPTPTSPASRATRPAARRLAVADVVIAAIVARTGRRH